MSNKKKQFINLLLYRWRMLSYIACFESAQTIFKSQKPNYNIEQDIRAVDQIDKLKRIIISYIP